MSEDQPQSQPPSSGPAADPSETNTEKGTQTSQKTIDRFQSVLKAQSIRALRGTIEVLEGVVEKLEATSTSTTSSNFLDELQSRRNASLEKIRSFLPGNLSSKLSDTALTSTIIGIAVIVVWRASTLLPGKPPEVASIPAPDQVTAPTINTPPELVAPAVPKPIEISPLSEPETPLPPPLVLTPEQNLIASIENQINEITDRYADGLIQSIQANFQGSRLTVKVGNDWYNLKQLQQDKLAARMLERSRELDFSRLELTDPKGTLLARSPVVGNNMVILKRQTISDQKLEGDS